MNIDGGIETSLLDKFSLRGKVAVVTGASSGLGVAIAIGLAQAGADVAIGARRTAGLGITADRIRALGRRVVAVQTNVTDEAQCDRLIQGAVAELGKVDILVNNAGFGGEYHTATEDPPAHFRSVVDVNLNGTYWMVQAAARVMPAGSSIINISSVMALTTIRLPAAGYSAAKAGVLGLTRDLARQFGAKGIRVNALLPGVFPSEGTAFLTDSDKKRTIDNGIPIGRIGDPMDLAAAVVFLAGDASAYITGVSLPVDGGALLV